MSSKIENKEYKNQDEKTLQNEITGANAISCYYWISFFLIIPSFILWIIYSAYNVLGEGDFFSVKEHYFIFCIAWIIQLIIFALFCLCISYGKIWSIISIVFTILIGFSLSIFILYNSFSKQSFLLSDISKLYNQSYCSTANLSANYENFTQQIYQEYFCKPTCPCKSIISFPNISINKNGSEKAQDCANFHTKYSWLMANTIRKNELELNCSGICTTTPYFLFTNVSQKVSNINCMKARLDDFFKYWTICSFILGCATFLFPFFVLIKCPCIQKDSEFLTHRAVKNFGNILYNEGNNVNIVDYREKMNHFDNESLAKNLNWEPENNQNIKLIESVIFDKKREKKNEPQQKNKVKKLLQNLLLEGTSSTFKNRSGKWTATEQKSKKTFINFFQEKGLEISSLEFKLLPQDLQKTFEEQDLPYAHINERYFQSNVSPFGLMLLQFFCWSMIPVALKVFSEVLTSKNFDSCQDQFTLEQYPLATCIACNKNEYSLENTPNCGLQKLFSWDPFGFSEKFFFLCIIIAVIFILSYTWLYLKQVYFTSKLKNWFLTFGIIVEEEMENNLHFYLFAYITLLFFTLLGHFVTESYIGCLSNKCSIIDERVVVFKFGYNRLSEGFGILIFYILYLPIMMQLKGLITNPYQELNIDLIIRANNLIYKKPVESNEQNENDPAMTKRINSNPAVEKQPFSNFFHHVMWTCDFQDLQTSCDFIYQFRSNIQRLDALKNYLKRLRNAIFPFLRIRKAIEYSFSLIHMQDIVKMMLSKGLIKGINLDVLNKKEEFLKQIFSPGLDYKMIFCFGKWKPVYIISTILKIGCWAVIFFKSNLFFFNAKIRFSFVVAVFHTCCAIITQFEYFSRFQQNSNLQNDYYNQKNTLWKRFLLKAFVTSYVFSIGFTIYFAVNFYLLRIDDLLVVVTAIIIFACLVFDIVFLVRFEQADKQTIKEHFKKSLDYEEKERLRANAISLMNKAIELQWNESDKETYKIESPEYHRLKNALEK